MLQRKDLYYILTIILVVVLFGVWIIPQFINILIIHNVSTWLLILIVCVILPLVALGIVWLIVLEIQSHYKTSEPSDVKIEENLSVNEAVTDEDANFIEEKMREQLEEQQFDDEEIFKFSKKLVYTYVNTRIKTDKVIPLKNISERLEIPLEVVKNILLLLIADNLINGMIKMDALVRYD